MAEVVSKHGAGVIMMHNSDTKEYKDLMGDIIRFLRKSVEIAEKAGITRENMVIDPGIGFGKTLEHNLEVPPSPYFFCQALCQAVQACF